MDGIELKQMRVHRVITHRVIDKGDLRAAFQERTKGEFTVMSGYS